MVRRLPYTIDRRSVDSTSFSGLDDSKPKTGGSRASGVASGRSAERVARRDDASDDVVPKTPQKKVDAVDPPRDVKKAKADSPPPRMFGKKKPSVVPATDQTVLGSPFRTVVKRGNLDSELWAKALRDIYVK